MSTPTASTVHLAVYDTLADWQFGLAIAHLVGHPHRQRSARRFVLQTVGATRDPVVTTAGVRILPDLTLDELEPADSAMLILAGGDAWVPLYDLRAACDLGVDEPDLLSAFAGKARAFVDAGCSRCGDRRGDIRARPRRAARRPWTHQ